MTMKNNDLIIDQINEQIQYLLNIRAMFPHMPKEAIGNSEFRTAPFYQAQGFNITFSFSKPVDKEMSNKISSIGRWVNQNFIIRLCALLESHHIIPPKGKGKINQNLQGHNELDIVRRLRNKFAHTSGKYISTNPEQKRLYNKVVETFNLDVEDADLANEFPVPIDTLLLPLAEGCKQYVRELNANRANPQA